MAEPHLEAEQIELAAMQELFTNLEPTLAAELGVRVEEFDGAVAFSALALESILFNRVLGLGMPRPATAAQLDALAAHYAALGISNYLVHVHPDARPTELVAWLTDKGYVPFRRAWAKFMRGIEPISPPATTLRTEPIGSEHSEAFATIVAEAYGLKPQAKALLQRVPERPGFSIYACFARDEPAAAAAMYVRGEAAWFGFAATRRQFRGRGGQNSLLWRRIEDALALGCKRLYVETGEPAEGDPQNSYRNIQRAGFRRIYVRDNYILCAPK